MLKLQNSAQFCALKVAVGAVCQLIPLHLSGPQLLLLAHLSLTKQGVSGPGALY